MAKYHPISENIRSLVPDERVEDRLEILSAFVDELLSEQKFGEKVFLNMALLTAMIRSYFVDVERYKYFHNLEYIESYKIASYSVKWILKTKPIQFRMDDPDEILDPTIFILNELFALQWSFALADIDLETISDDQFAEIIYTFQYRAISEDTLTLVFKALGGNEAQYDG